MKQPFLVAVLLLCSLLASAASGDLPTQIESARRTLAREPGNLDARFHLARALAWQRQFDEARKQYARLLRAKPKNADYLLGLAQIHLWQNHPSQSLRLAKKARSLAPGYADVWQVQIQSLLALGGNKNRQQASALRIAARQRFPHRDWAFAALDGPAPAPILAATPGATAPAPEVISHKAASSQPQTITERAVAPEFPPVPKTAGSAALPPAPAARLEVEGSLTQEHLTGGLPDWRAATLFIDWRDEERRSWYGGWRDISRYNLADSEAHVGTAQPVGGGTTLQGEIGSSNSHHVLPRNYGQLNLHQNLGADWLASIGWRTSSFDAGRTAIGSFAVEKTLDSHRIGYTLYEGRPEGAGFSPSHRVQWAYDYGDRNVLSLSLTKGRETESTGNARFLSSAVSGASIGGRHWMSPAWALIWEALQQKQGDLYTRSGLRLGLRHAY